MVTGTVATVVAHNVRHTKLLERFDAGQPKLEMCHGNFFTDYGITKEEKTPHRKQIQLLFHSGTILPTGFSKLVFFLT